MRIHFWNLFFLIFYVVLFVLGLEWLAQTNKLVSWVPLGDFVLMALAVHRLVRLFTYDAITHFMREWFAEEDDRTLRGTIGVLINCPWCTGLWFALIVMFGYFATPYAWYAILVLALAAVGTFLQLMANWAGNVAGLRKLEVEKLKRELD